MAVLGAQFVRPDFSAGAKISQAQQLRDKPFNDAIKTGNSWLAQRRKTQNSKTQQEFENNQTEARLTIAQSQAKTAEKTAQLQANKFVVEREAANREVDTQLRVDTTAKKNLTAIQGVLERYNNDPDSVTDSELLKARAWAGSMSTSASANDGNAALIELTRIDSDRNTDFLLKNRNTAKTFAAKGDLYSTEKDAIDASGGLWAYKALVTGDATEGQGAQFGVEVGTLSSVGLAKANTIINRMTRGDGGLDSLSPEDEQFLEEAKQDKRIADRLETFAEDQGDLAQQIAKEDRGLETFRKHSEIQEEFDIESEKRGLTTDLEKAQLLQELKDKHDANRPAKITKTVREDDFGVTTTIVGTGSQRAIDDVDALDGGPVKNFFSSGPTVGQRPAGMTSERFDRLKVNARAKVDRLDADIAEKRALILEDDDEGLEHLSGIGFDTAEENLKDLEDERTRTVNNAAAIGIDLSGGAVQPQPKPQPQPEPQPPEDPTPTIKPGDKGTEEMLKILNALN